MLRKEGRKKERKKERKTIIGHHCKLPRMTEMKSIEYTKSWLKYRATRIVHTVDGSVFG